MQYSSWSGAEGEEDQQPEVKYSSISPMLNKSPEASSQKLSQSRNENQGSTSMDQRKGRIREWEALSPV